MTRVAFDGRERGIRYRTAECVIDDVEPFVAGVLSDAVLHGRVPVDGNSAKSFDD